jgi:benzil reductase ((S)-benzoin forming)
MVTMRQIVWITGASSGIGAALAATAPEAARVIGISRRPASVGESVRADLSEPAEWDRVSAVIAAVLEAARPEIPMLLHFAGAAEPMGPMRAADPEAYARAVLLNAASGQVLGARFISACAGLALSPTIVMCSSPAAALPRAGMTHYSAGKSALQQWARAAALEEEGRPHAATVFSVVPYAVDTPLVRAAMTQPAEALPLAEVFRAAAARGGLADPSSTAREIWALVEAGVEPGAAVAVGAVPPATT